MTRGHLCSLVLFCLLPAAPPSPIGDGVALPSAPICFLALSMARWCWLREACRASLTSIRLSIVSLSGAGLSAFMYSWMLREALRHRSANSLISSLASTSLGGVQATTCSSRPADVRASSSRLASSTGSGSFGLLCEHEKYSCEAGLYPPPPPAGEGGYWCGCGCEYGCCGCEYGYGALGIGGGG